MMVMKTPFLLKEQLSASESLMKIKKITLVKKDIILDNTTQEHEGSVFAKTA